MRLIDYIIAVLNYQSLDIGHYAHYVKLSTISCAVGIVNSLANLEAKTILFFIISICNLFSHMKRSNLYCPIRFCNLGLASTDNKQMFTHDLSRLLDYAEAEGLELFVPDYIKNHVNQITDWEAGSRYDFNFACRIDTLKKCCETIEEWEKQV